MPVDASRVPGSTHAFQIVAAGRKAVEINARYAAQREHDGLRCQESLDVHLQRNAFVAQGIEVRDVEFVGALAAVGLSSHAHPTAQQAHAADKLLDSFGRHQSFERTDADSVVRGGEVEKRCAGRRVFQLAKPTL